mmetsp:Transcript_32014/g.78115  ORF Transcript_32014/g.78115 Transcript_32014/m.78115 type:complete len:294 (+) Transcript_32014:428-1309(+)
MGTPPTIGVNDDLPTSQTSIPVRTTDHKPATWVQMIHRLIIQILGRNNGLDHMLHDIGTDLLVGHILRMLSGDQDRVHTLGDHGTILTLLVLHGHLRLPIRSHPWAGPVLTDLRQLPPKLGGQGVGERHQLRRLVRSVSEHVTLIASTNVLDALRSHAVHSLPDVRGLLLKLVQHLHGPVVQTLRSIVVPDLLAGVTHNLLIVHLRLRGDLTEHHHHPSLRACLASNAAVRVLGQQSIHHSIRHLIRQLVRVALVHGLRREQKASLTRRLDGGHDFTKEQTTAERTKRLSLGT